MAEHLHRLAPHYWNKPETANCTIVIPTPRPSPHPSRRGKRAAHPDPDTARVTLRLHREYLSAKSIFFRDLFTGVSPLDLIQNICTSRLPPSSAPLRIPRSRLPRFLPSPPSHPVVFLPIPDPSSIQPLLHWMYFGNTDHIENALDRGHIQWEGLARNVEYLVLSTDIKVFLGRWYRSWYLPARCSPATSPCPADEDEGDESDLDSESDDSDSDAYYSGSPATPSSGDDDEEIESKEECDRGRTRDIKPLVRLCGQLRLLTT